MLPNTEGSIVNRTDQIRAQDPAGADEEKELNAQNRTTAQMNNGNDRIQTDERRFI